MNESTRPPADNRLLAALPPGDYERIASHLKPVELRHGECRGDELPLTQEFLSLMLGVRRAGVTEAAIALQAEGLIKYRRGHITVLDREGLEGFACECYPVLKAEFDRLQS